ncbi:MAG: cytochrome c biogenesis protein CcdA [Bryobacteraceae bacterium]
MVRTHTLPFALALLALPALAQDPVQWSLTADPATAAPGSHILLRLKAVIEPGWHLYSTTTPAGPIPTRLLLDESPDASATRALQPEPARKFDPNFKSESETYDGQVEFLIETAIATGAPPGPRELTVRVRYQVCSDKVCLRARTKPASATVTIAPGAATVTPAIPDGYVAAQLGSPAAPATSAAATPPPQYGSGTTGNVDLGRFLAIAFGFGLAAIFTPCVFPMIPITMSFFLNRQEGTRAQAVTQAAIFCLGIIVLFTGMGLATTAILGPFGVVQLGSNPWVNGFISVVFLAFGLSLLGAFEITLPSGLLTRLNDASQGGGIAGTLLMGLTFSLTSFACVGPFVGTLLAASVQGGGMLPALGMATFAAGLAAPFFLLALFPAYLKKLPKSGGWLARVKTVMGFVILAAMFKYWSNIDLVMQWDFLTRDRFLASWIVLFALPGLYLLGFLRLEGIKPDEPLGVARTLIGAAFLIFSVSLLPGMNCGRLGEIDAYVPACPEGAASASGATSGLKWMKNDYKAALERARTEGKLVFVNFTGYACTNCHWMKANMFPRPEIAEALSKYVLVELYTDGTDEASLENQKLQETRFQTVAIPHYAIIDPNEKIAASFVGLTKDAKEFLAFLGTPTP